MPGAGVADYIDPSAEGTIPVIQSVTPPTPPAPSDLAELARSIRDAGQLAEAGLAALDPAFNLAQASFIPEGIRADAAKAQQAYAELRQYVILANIAIAEVMGTVGRIYSYASDIATSDDSVS